MTLAAGSRLGPYEITGPLGAGGMGEVWKARDTRLERSVAIKVLPAEFAENAQLKLRFEREAKTISQLNHPNICTLYDVGEADVGPALSRPGQAESLSHISYLVMELLEGENLADRLSKGPLPIEQVLRYGIEIAGALEKAHKAGVVHRDLKPGNVMITKSGAKLLDFGLAKPNETGVLSALTSLRTEKRNLTEEGTIVGTIQYMAPEQIEGGEIDARTDIFALGALLYEMATGRHAFEGKSKASLIASILTTEPQPISAMQPMTPATFDRVVRTCLQKDPDDRWQSAHDVAQELRWIADYPATEIVRTKRDWSGWAVAVVLLLAAAAFAYLWQRVTATPPLRVEASLLPPEDHEFSLGSPAISPDGTRMAFVARSKTDSKTHLWIRRLDSGAQQDLGIEGGGAFWSPDSRSIAFFKGTDRKLERVDAAGGPPQYICDLPPGRAAGGTWGPQGTILFGAGGRHGLYRVSASGGVPVEVTKLDPAHDTNHRWPSFLPDGKHFLYSTQTFGYAESGRVYVGSLDSSERKMLVPTSFPAVYSPTGHLLFCRDRALVAQPFNLKRLELRDDPVVVADNIYTFALASWAAFSVSTNGVLAYQQGMGQRSQFIWRDRSGKQVGIVGEVGDFQRPSLSHDGRHLAYELVSTDGRSDIWIYDLVRQTATRFTSDPGSETNAIWSADDRYIVYTSEELQHGSRTVMRRESNGAGLPEKLFDWNGVAALTGWSSDGRFIFFHDGNDIFYYSIPDHKVIPLVQTPFIDQGGRLSPDGRWLAYGSEQSGHMEIYVQPFPKATAVWKISTAGGSQPRWTSAGRELIYETLDRKVMAVDIRVAGETLEAGTPKLLFPYQLKPGGWPLDVAADGQRFLVNEAVRDESSTPITLVLNWAADLKK